MSPKLTGLIVAVGVAASLVSTAASAQDPAFGSKITVKTVQFPYSDQPNGDSILNYGSDVWGTPIVMTTSTGLKFTTFCHDVPDHISAGSKQNLPFTVGFVTRAPDPHVAGGALTLTEAQSNIMGQIADIGLYDYAHKDVDGAEAAQAAIWAVEYNVQGSGYDFSVNTTKGDPAFWTDFAKDLKVTDNGRGYALGIISGDGTQNQIFGGVPEPTTWAMLILGLGMVGLAARRRAAELALAA